MTMRRRQMRTRRGQRRSSSPEALLLLPLQDRKTAVSGIPAALPDKAIPHASMPNFLKELIKRLVPWQLRDKVKRLIRGPVHYKDYYGARTAVSSVDYLAHEEILKEGLLPDKFARLLPLIEGDRILEIGSAEGILAMALTASKSKVVSLDITPARQEAGKKLQEAWIKAGRKEVTHCEFVCGDIFERFDLLKDADTVIASRVIYYFHEAMHDLISACAAHGVASIVLVGNEYRAGEWDKNRDGKELGKYAYYSTVAGMRELLEKHGYAVTTVIPEGDPVVVGRLGATS